MQSGDLHFIIPQFLSGDALASRLKYRQKPDFLRISHFSVTFKQA
jgi:hypothetical protein